MFQHARIQAEPRTERASPPHVGDFYFLRCRGITEIPLANYRAVQPDAHRRRWIIEFRVIHFHGQDIFHRASGRNAGNKRSHQQPGERSATIREVINVRLPFVLSGDFNAQSG